MTDATTIDATAELQAAQDSEVEINGITGITRSTNTIDNAVEGVTFTIANDAAVDDTATVSVSKDTGKATKAVQAFVDQYNSLNDFIDTKTSYDPDTGRSGILNGDSTLSRLQSNIRTMFTDGVNSGSTYDNMYSVGISIDRDGVMSFDSGELEDALNDSPTDVMNLFKAETDDEGFDGVATRLDGYLDQLIQSNTGTIPNRLDYFDNEIERVEDDIADIERSMEMTRERYIEQFSAMEEAISEMQSQQSWMMSQLSSMGSSSTVSSML
jgi:flagellar hook-associated protein 2